MFSLEMAFGIFHGLKKSLSLYCKCTGMKNTDGIVSIIPKELYIPKTCNADATLFVCKSS